MNQAPDFGRADRRQHRRARLLQLALAALALAGVALMVAMWTGTPGPQLICWRLGSALESNNYRAPGIPHEHREGESKAEGFDRQCRVYFELAREQLDEDRYAEFTRCLVGTSELERAHRCFLRVYEHDKWALRAAMAATFSEFPPYRPAELGELEPAYDALVEVSSAALDACPSLYEPGRGCLAYELPERIDAVDEAIGRPIPGPRPPADAQLVGLEVRCSLDTASFVAARPELEAQLRASPIPTAFVSCSFLPEGRSPSSCAGSGVSVGYGDNVAEYSPAVPGRLGAGPDCKEGLRFITIRRKRGSVHVELEAAFSAPR